MAEAGSAAEVRCAGAANLAESTGRPATGSITLDLTAEVREKLAHGTVDNLLRLRYATSGTCRRPSS
jgi:hypothetical protein